MSDGGDRLLGGRRFGDFHLFRLVGDHLLGAAVDGEGQRRRAAAEREKRDHRDSGQQRHDQHDGGRHAERLGIAGELAEQRLVGGAGDAGLGDEEAGGGRNDQRRNLRDQPVADGQQRVILGGVGEAQALLHDADDHAADDVDHDDEEPGDGVAADEFRGAVHGAEKTRFVFQRLAPPPRLLLVDEAGIEIGVDGHLLARHGIEVKARRHFGDASGALGDDHEIHDHQDREHDDADDEIAAHDEIAERLDDVAGGGRAFVAMGENEPRRGEIERQPQHGGDQTARSGTRRIPAAPG